MDKLEITSRNGKNYTVAVNPVWFHERYLRFEYFISILAQNSEFCVRFIEKKYKRNTLIWKHEFRRGKSLFWRFIKKKKHVKSILFLIMLSSENGAIKIF